MVCGRSRRGLITLGDRLNSVAVFFICLAMLPIIGISASVLLTGLGIVIAAVLMLVSLLVLLTSPIWVLTTACEIAVKELNE